MPLSRGEKADQVERVRGSTKYCLLTSRPPVYQHAFLYVLLKSCKPIPINQLRQQITKTYCVTTCSFQPNLFLLFHLRLCLNQVICDFLVYLLKVTIHMKDLLVDFRL